MSDSTNWRPTTSFPIYWSDDELKKLGWVAAMSSHCEQRIKLVVKSVEYLDYNQWLRLDHSPAIDLSRRIRAAAEKLDSELLQIAQVLVLFSKEAFSIRAEIFHGMVGEDPLSNTPISYHVRHRRLHGSRGIDQAVELFADLDGIVDQAVKRTADLIIDGVLPGGRGRKGFSMRWRDQNVRF